jgi:outer membrane protein
MGEIAQIAVEVAKRKGATVVLDSSGPTVLGIPTLLYSDKDYNITEEVMQEINKDRPPAPAATPTPAATTPPASTNPPPSQFTVPNVTPAKTEPKKP